MADAVEKISPEKLLKEIQILKKEVLKKALNPKYKLKVDTKNPLPYLGGAPDESLTEFELGTESKNKLVEALSGVVPLLFRHKESKLAGQLLSYIGKLEFEDEEYGLKLKEIKFDAAIKESLQALAGRSMDTAKKEKGIEKAYKTILKHGPEGLRNYLECTKEHHIKKFKEGMRTRR